MTQEDKELLIKDLCGRLPYGVKIIFKYNGFRWDWEETLHEIGLCDDGEYSINGWGIHGIKPYLRPMSSMSEKEKERHFQLMLCGNAVQIIEFYNQNHLDYMLLIEKGLALEAPEGMYNI
jgi:hypothetical protein